MTYQKLRVFAFSNDSALVNKFVGILENAIRSLWQNISYGLSTNVETLDDAGYKFRGGLELYFAEKHEQYVESCRQTLLTTVKLMKLTSPELASAGVYLLPVDQSEIDDIIQKARDQEERDAIPSSIRDLVTALKAAGRNVEVLKIN